jgi:hypothetical protein
MPLGEQMRRADRFYTWLTVYITASLGSYVGLLIVFKQR